MAHTLNSQLIRVGVAPDVYNFEACIDRAPRDDQRTYTINFVGPGQIKVHKVAIRGSGAGFFTLISPPRVDRQGPGPLLTFTVTFRPTKAKRYRAKLKIHYVLYRPNGSILSIWDDVMLEGVGTVCAVPAGPGAAGPGAVPGGGPGGIPGGDPGAGVPGADPHNGSGEGGTEDGSEPAEEETTDTEQESGGGNSSGSDLPAAGLQEKIICVRFRCVSGIGDDIDEADLDRWLAEANGVWKRAGIKFERAKRPFEKVEGPLNKVAPDPHCLDVFVGGKTMIGGPTLGTTHVDADLPARAIEVHERFRKKGGYCGNGFIELESGHPEDTASPGTVLAHEFGHALGLGSVPNPNAEEQEHLDPTDGQPITNEERLMYPKSGGGTKLTDLEVRIARKLQEYVKGGQPRYSGCTKTSSHISEPSTNLNTETAGVAIRSFPESLAAHIRFPRQFGLADAEGTELALDLDLLGTGTANWTALYTYLPDQPVLWSITGPPPSHEEAIALAAPARLYEVDRPQPEAPDLPAEGLAVSIPKDYLGVFDGVIGWRLRGRFGAFGERNLPARGFASLDLTRPSFTLDLDDYEPIQVASGGVLELEGSAIYSSTFTGTPSLTFRLSGMSDVLGQAGLDPSTAGRWSLNVALPKELAPGEHQGWVRADCPECGVSTSLPVVFVVGRK